MTSLLKATGRDNFGTGPLDSTGIMRWEFMAGLLRTNGLKRGAEVGVADGVFTREILARVPDSIVHAVDHWEPRRGRSGHTMVPDSVGKDHRVVSDYGGWDRDWQLAQVTAIADEFPRRCLICQATSKDAAAMLARERIILDWVFIDASHQYREVSDDIRAWSMLVRPGGIVAGHDRSMDGVARALCELGDRHLTGPDDCWYWRA